MTNWEFETVPAYFVQQNPTQRDQFNNDEVGLVEALVREVIQNSTDAAAGDGPVKVCFSVRTLSEGQASELKGYFSTLQPHLEACQIDVSPLDATNPRLLVVEDFATKGLTGDPGAIDSRNFDCFWRKHGGSAKGGKSLGRWGLGKLVYSSSSRLNAFFGLTVREGDESPLLLGQAVLKNHVLDGKRRPAHGFWFRERGDEDIQLPIRDKSVIDDLRNLTGISRELQPGLSVVVPYLRPGINDDVIIEAVLENYYFPILAGRLAVEVGSTVIDRDSFQEVASKHPGIRTGSEAAFSFVEAVSSRLNSDADFVAVAAPKRKGITDRLFAAEDIETMKERYRNGELVHVRVPIQLQRKNGDMIDTFVSLFMRSLPEDEKPFSLFVRGSITVPGEKRYFSGVQAFGAMVATDDGITEFLGDAENPAHTNWIASAEKLSDRWRSTHIVTRVRYALTELHQLIGEQEAREDRDALLDLFSLVDPSSSKKGKRRRSKKPDPNPPKREKAISICKNKVGFEVVAGPGAAKWSFPKRVRVRVAYDTMIGNPFKAHHKFDFDLTEGEIDLQASNAKIEVKNKNTFDAIVENAEFTLSGGGFGDKRDIVVDARAA